MRRLNTHNINDIPRYPEGRMSGGQPAAMTGPGIELFSEVFTSDGVELFRNAKRELAALEARKKGWRSAVFGYLGWKKEVL